MKGIILFNFSILILSVSCVVVFSQQKPTGIKITEPNQSSEISQYKGWKKIELSAYSFYVPKDFELIRIQGVDATYWEYKSENINFSIIEGSYAPDPSPIPGKGINIKYKTLLISGVSAQMGSYEYKSEDYKYVRAVHFKPPKWKVSSVTIALESKNVEGQDLAKKIFDSIRFKDSN